MPAPRESTPPSSTAAANLQNDVRNVEDDRRRQLFIMYCRALAAKEVHKGLAPAQPVAQNNLAQTRPKLQVMG